MNGTEIEEGEEVSQVEDLKISELKAVYKLAIQTRNFEIQQLINRNNFFMLFQGVLLAAVFSNQAPKPFVEFIICIAGIYISWHQVKVAAGAKYWQEWWELKTSEIEGKLKETLGSQGFISLFDMDDPDRLDQHNKIRNKIDNQKSWIESLCNSLILKKYSVSRVPIRSGLILMLTWFSIFISTLNLSGIDGWIKSINIIEGIYFKSDTNVSKGTEDEKNIDWTTKVKLKQGERLVREGHKAKGPLEETDIYIYLIQDNEGNKVGSVIYEDHIAQQGLDRQQVLIQKDINGNILMREIF